MNDHQRQQYEIAGLRADLTGVDLDLRAVREDAEADEVLEDLEARLDDIQMDIEVIEERLDNMEFETEQPRDPKRWDAADRLCEFVERLVGDRHWHDPLRTEAERLIQAVRDRD